MILRIRARAGSGPGASSQQQQQRRRRGSSSGAAACPAGKEFLDIPGPRPAPFIGNLWRYLPLIGDMDPDRMHVNGSRLQRRFGDLVREETVPGRTVLHVFAPADMEAVFRHEGRHPARLSHRALLRYRQQRPHLYSSGGLFPTNGGEWRRLRSLVQKPMLSGASQRVLAPALEEATGDLLRRLHRLRDRQGVVDDALVELYNWALECTGLVAMDKRLGCLDPERGPGAEALSLVRAAASTHRSVMVTENRLPLWRYWQELSPAYRELVRAQDTMASIIRGHLDLQQDGSPPHGAPPPAARGNALSVLQQFRANPELSPADVFTMILDLFLAGIDTTAYSTAFALYHLSRNPDQQALLRGELRELLSSPDDPVTPEVIAEAHYLRACLKESLRLHPIAIGVGRVMPQDVWLSGYMVPRGTMVITHNQVACRSPEHFRDPDSFRPERWLRGHVSEERPHPFLFLPFGQGPRSCLGRRFALAEMHLALAKVFRGYQVTYAGEGPMDCVTRLINVPDRALRLRMVPLTP